MLGQIFAISWARHRTQINGLHTVEGMLNTTAGVLGMILVLLASLAIGVGFAVITYFMASDLESETSDIVFLSLFSFCMFSGILIPFIVGMLREGLNFSRLLFFPISRFGLFAMALGSSSLAPRHLFYYPALVLVSLTGILLAEETPLAGLIIMLLMGLLTVIWSFTFVTGLELVLRVRQTKELVAVLLGCGMMLLGFATLFLVPEYPEKIALPIEQQTLQALGASARLAIRQLPPAVATAGLHSLREHDQAGAVSALVQLLGWLFAGSGLAYLVFSRSLLGGSGWRNSPGHRNAGRRTAKIPAGSWDFTDLPLFSRQTLAVLEKELRHLLHNASTLLGFATGPFLVLVVVYGGLFDFSDTLPAFGNEPLTLYGLIAFMVFSASSVACNAFAPDGRGASSYFFLPVKLQRVILGKNLAMAISATINLALLLVSWSFFAEPLGAAVWIKATLIFACLQLTVLAVANLVAIAFPGNAKLGTLGAGTVWISQLLISMTMMLLSGILGGLFLMPLLADLPVLVPWLLILLLAVLVLLYRGLLAVAATMMSARREKIVEANKT